MRSDEQTHLAPGYRLDRYELLFPIGVGGMASVWGARLRGKHGFEKLVAVKTILPRFARDPKFQEMFLDEARIAARIQHANVAQILDLGDHFGVLFLVMEWVDGDALSRLVHAVRDRGENIPVGIAVRILADVCAGLHAAHELRDRSGVSLGIVHRDVSPHNILVATEGGAKLIDFGIAKARDRAAGDTDTGSFKGKVKYMAPEQAVAPKSTDRRADLWAAGAVLYALLSGSSPYESENDMATLLQLAQRGPPAPLPASVPEQVRTVVMKALAWDPDDRYATAEELRKALLAGAEQAGASATHADVAAYAAHHLVDRIEARAKAIGIALGAAEERSRVARLLNPEESGSLPASLPQDTKVQRSSDAPTDVLSGPVVETGSTLGAAATMTMNLPGGKRRQGIVAAIGATVLLAALALLFHRGEHPPSPARVAAAEPAPPGAPSLPAESAPPPAAPPDPPPAVSPPAPAPPPAAVASEPPPAPAAPRRASPPRGPDTGGRPRATQTAPSPGKHRGEYGF